MLVTRILCVYMAACMGINYGLPQHAECGKVVLHSNGGELVSHKSFGMCQYPVGMDCSWDIDASPHKPDWRLEISFSVFELPLDNKPCSRTYLQFHDRVYPGALFKDLCDGRVIPAPFNSTSSKVRVAFRTTHFGAKGFIMKWRKFHICSPGEFQCANGYGCVKPEFRCDGGNASLNDCGDGSDEVGCTELTSCPSPDTTMCSNKMRCFDNANKCDGVPDCRDNTDEENCPKVKCDPQTQFQCNEYHCISKGRECDGVPNDCKKNADEAHCKRQVCDPVTQFRCDHKFACIPKEDMCNGASDCNDNADEKDCGLAG